MQPTALSWRERPEFLLPLVPVVGYFLSKGLWIPPALMALWWGVLAVRGRGGVPLSIRGVWSANPFLWLFGVLAVASLIWNPFPAAAWARPLLLLFEIAFVIILARAGSLVPLARWGGPVSLMLGLAAVAGLVSALDVAMEGHLLAWTGRSAKDSVFHLWASYSPGGVSMGLMFLPAILVAWRAGWKKTTILSTILILLTFYLNYSGTLRAGLPLAVLAGGVVFLWSPLVRLLAPLAVLAMVTMPFMIGSLPEEAFYCNALKVGGSLAHRTIIWESTIKGIRERPLLGWGMESGKTLPGGKDKVPLSPCVDGHKDPTVQAPMVERVGLHPHNASLQIWLDFGLAGIVLAGLALWRAIGAALATAHRRLDMALVTAVMTLAFLTLNTSFSLWHSWLLGPVMLAVMLLRAALAAPDAGGDALVVGKTPEGTNGG